MTTSELSPQTDWLPTASESISSAAASPARTSVWPALALALQAPGVDCGANTSDSFASLDPDGSSWRTSQRCLLGGWERYSETWPRSGMTRSGTAFRLPVLAPLTDATESGSLPTPLATSYGTNQGGGASRVGPIRPSLETMARKNLWPTPRANDSEKRGNFDSTNPRNGLPAAVKLYPTPRTTGLDWGRNSRKAAKARGMWPTPGASDEKNRCSNPAMARKRLDSGKQIGLETAVHLWAAPNARDWKDTDPTQGNRQSPNLGTQVGGNLNPTWVEWLMGFPLGWTVLEHWVTRSSRKSSK